MLIEAMQCKMCPWSTCWAISKDDRAHWKKTECSPMLLQAELDCSESVKALRRFNDLLQNLPADSWGAH